MIDRQLCTFMGGPEDGRAEFIGDNVDVTGHLDWRDGERDGEYRRQYAHRIDGTKIPLAIFKWEIADA